MLRGTVCFSYWFWNIDTSPTWVLIIFHHETNCQICSKPPCFISNWSSYLINLVPDHCWEKGLCQNLFFFLNNEFINLFVNIISLTISCNFPFNFIPEKKWKSWHSWIYFYCRNCPRLLCQLFSTNQSAFFRESQSIWSIPSFWKMLVYVTTQ